MCKLSINGTFMTHHRAGYRMGTCDGSDHSINLSRARGHSLGLREMQDQQPVPGPPRRNKMVAPEVGEVSELGSRCSTGLPVVRFQQL